MQDKITIADAPYCLNTNDKAMWVLGYQAAIEARSTCLLQIQEPPTKTEALAHYSKQAILAMDEAAPAAVAVPDERAAFESDWLRRHYPLPMNTRLRDDGRYADHIIQGQFEAWNAGRAALAATPAADGNPYLSNEDLEDLRRFEGMASDWESYDIAKKRMKRLAELGVVRWMGGSRYSMTAFGQYALQCWDHLPLETHEEANARVGAEFRARIERLNAEAIAAQAATKKGAQPR